MMSLARTNSVFSIFWTLRVGGPILNLRRIDPSREQGLHDEARISFFGGHSARGQRGLLSQHNAMSVGEQGLRNRWDGGTVF
jgi:hypothetical protein